MTDDIPTGDKTTVPISELEKLAEEWEGERKGREHNTLTNIACCAKEQCAAELQDLINEHDPKHGGD